MVSVGRTESQFSTTHRIKFFSCCISYRRGQFSRGEFSMKMEHKSREFHGQLNEFLGNGSVSGCACPRFLTQFPLGPRPPEKYVFLCHLSLRPFLFTWSPSFHISSLLNPLSQIVCHLYSRFRLNYLLCIGRIFVILLFFPLQTTVLRAGLFS